MADYLAVPATATRQIAQGEHAPTFRLILTIAEALDKPVNLATNAAVSQDAAKVEQPEICP